MKLMKLGLKLIVCISGFPYACKKEFFLQWILTSVTYLTFYQTRLPDLPPVHSMGLIS